MTAITDALKVHQARNRNKKVALAAFFVMSIVFLITDILIGSQGLTLHQVLSALFHPTSSSIASRIIVWDIRMPMSLMAPLVGAA
ncbi:iron ABC transporter permease [Photobacterium damselae]|nr:iron ABC transporter permease [Photobacterium damselae]